VACTARANRGQSRNPGPPTPRHRSFYRRWPAPRGGPAPARGGVRHLGNGRRLILHRRPTHRAGALRDSPITSRPACNSLPWS